jgi:hypothetical protein
MPERNLVPVTGLTTNTLDPAAPGIIEENLTSRDDLRCVVEHLLLELVDRGALRTAEETAIRRRGLMRLFDHELYRPEIAAKATQCRRRARGA